MIGDIIPPRERGRYQGFFGAVFGVSTVIGPLLGGFFVDNLSWRWIFYVNIPVGLAALAVIGATFRPHDGARAPRRSTTPAPRRSPARSRRSSSSRRLGGSTYDWGSPQIVALVVLALVLVPAFVWIEARAAEPILPLALFRNRIFARLERRSASSSAWRSSARSRTCRSSCRW